MFLLMASLLWSSWHSHKVLWMLPKDYIKKDVIITADIVSIPQHYSHNDVFQVHLLSFNKKSVDASITLTWYNQHPELHVGDRWRFIVRLVPPHGLQNPSGFDRIKALSREGISATGYVVTKGSSLISTRTSPSLLAMRQAVAEKIIAHVHPLSMSAILVSLTVGVRSWLSDAQWQVFQASGTSHLMAISGLHIGLVALVVYWTVDKLWRFLPWFLEIMPSFYIASLCSMLSAIAYSLLAGWSIPTQRACWMLMIVLFTRCYLYQTSLWQRLLLAFIVVVSTQPSAILSPSTWLTFWAVIWIAYIVEGRQGHYHKRKWQSAMTLQFAFFLGLMPFNILFFKQISLAVFLSNSIAIPWVSMVILPLALISTIFFVWLPSVSYLGWGLAAKLFSPLWWLLKAISGIPGIVIHFGAIHYVSLLSMMLGSFILLSPKGLCWRPIGLLWYIGFLFPYQKNPDLGDAWMTVLDVGQGLAVVVQTKSHTLIYDTGPKTYDGYDAGNAVVIPYLRYLRVKQLDMMMISHGDNDHIGGAPAILKLYPALQLLSSIPQALRPWSATPCYAGQHWRWDGVDFSVLWPNKGATYQGNNSSCVLQISHGDHAVLLTGDIEKHTEYQLINDYGDTLHADVLVAPHHGSKTSSSRPFLKAVQPQSIIFSTGYYNRFHFPASEVIKRCHQFNIKPYNTASQGAIKVDLNHPI